MCEFNDQCGDTCCGAESNQCVAPLLDCKDQMPLAAFISVMSISLLALLVLYYLFDRLERKRKIDRIKKQIAMNNLQPSQISMSTSAGNSWLLSNQHHEDKDMFNDNQ